MNARRDPPRGPRIASCPNQSHRAAIFTSTVAGCGSQLRRRDALGTWRCGRSGGASGSVSAPTRPTKRKIWRLKYKSSSAVDKLAPHCQTPNSCWKGDCKPASPVRRHRQIRCRSHAAGAPSNRSLAVFEPVSVRARSQFRILNFADLRLCPEIRPTTLKSPPTHRKRPRPTRLTPRNVGGSAKQIAHHRETGLTGWGAWIRTRGWRNQKPRKVIDLSRVFSAMSQPCHV